MAGRPKGSGVKITPEKQREILAILAIGGSRNDAADYVGVSKSTLHDTIAREEGFSEQVKRAEASGKVRHLKKLEKAQAWQASAWFLERKYRDEFGASQKVIHGGDENAPPIAIATMNMKGLSDAELAQMQALMMKAKGSEE